MRAITVRQPWALAIVSGAKGVENRTRNIAGNYQGTLLIHSAAQWSREAFADPILSAWLADTWGVTRETAVESDLPTRAVLGIVDLVGVHQDEDCYGDSLREVGALYRSDPAAYAALPDNGMGGLTGRARLCSEWAVDEHHHLQLANARKLPERIPATGRLGLWTPDADLIARVREQLRGEV